jgi:alpha-glucuronidase
MQNGDTLWQSLCRHYQRGVDAVRGMQQTWKTVRPYIDAERYQEVERKLQTQLRDAIWWKDACLLYFQQYARRPFPQDVAPAEHRLEDLQQVKLEITNFECPSEEMLDAVR